MRFELTALLFLSLSPALPASAVPRTSLDSLEARNHANCGITARDACIATCEAHTPVSIIYYCRQADAGATPECCCEDESCAS